jgi:hypothetical protein
VESGVFRAGTTFVPVTRELPARAAESEAPDPSCPSAEAGRLDCCWARPTSGLLANGVWCEATVACWPGDPDPQPARAAPAMPKTANSAARFLNMVPPIAAGINIVICGTNARRVMN